MTQSRLGFGSIVTNHTASWTLIDDFCANLDVDALFRRMRNEITWKHDSIQLYGRLVPIPRRHCWFADDGGDYRWSGLTMLGEAFPSWLEPVKAAVSEIAGVQFNTALANLYRDGQDSIAWHADDEPELGPQPVVASLSFGATRRFRLRRRRNHAETVSLELHQGSLLLMHEDCQNVWDHCVPKTQRVVGPRVNLTFRLLRGKSQ